MTKIGDSSSEPTPDWVFELEGTGSSPAQIPAEEVTLVSAAWKKLDNLKELDAKTGADIDELIERWKSRGFSADQIAVAAGLPIETVNSLLSAPGVVAYFGGRE